MNWLMKKEAHYILLTFVICCLFLCACGSKQEEEANAAEDGRTATITPYEEKNPVKPEKDSVTPPKKDKTPTPEPSPTPEPPSVARYHAIIYDNRAKGTKVEMEIAEGDTVDVGRFAQLSGYHFIGCYDEPDKKGELYIDKDGQVCTEVVADVILYAWYEPENYTLSFTCNGKDASSYGVQNVIAAYDADIREFLPLNRIINETELIYAVSYRGRTLADITENGAVLLNEAFFKDFESFASGSKIVLDLKTVTVFQEKRFGLQEVCIKDDFDQFGQRFKDEYVCDGLAFENIDFQLLEKLGFNTAVIEITCCMREKDDGKQEIYVYNTAFDNNPNDSKKEREEKVKAMEDFFLSSKTHDCKKTDTEETVTLSIEVSISRLKSGSGIYVYYGASGFGDDDWYRVYSNIVIKFDRRLDK